MSISLPLATEAVPCVDFALENRVDPGGTALAPDVVVLVEVGEPWPKPVAKHADLHDLVRIAQEHPGQVRLLAAIPHDPEQPRAIAFWPSVAGMRRAEAPLGADPAAALQGVLANSDSMQVDTATGPRTMLVCTQGSHDVCCGTHGAVFADWLETEHPNVETFRVSHTGGHRFSPTAMTLPDGRMWAYLTAESVDEILSRENAAAVSGQCRGWWGAPTGPAQIAERAVFEMLGFGFDEVSRTVTVGDDGNVEVAVGSDVYEVVVEVGREVPTIACSALGGLPAKPGREWVVVSGPTLR